MMTKLEIAAMITASMCSGTNVKGLSYEEIAEKALEMAEVLVRAHTAGVDNEPEDPQ